MHSEGTHQGSSAYQGNNQQTTTQVGCLSRTRGKISDKFDSLAGQGFWLSGLWEHGTACFSSPSPPYSTLLSHSNEDKTETHPTASLSLHTSAPPPPITRGSHLPIPAAALSDYCHS